MSADRNVDSRQGSVLCDHFIEVGDDPWAGTYCKLRSGHDGDHSQLYADESARCSEPGCDNRAPVSNFGGMCNDHVRELLA